MYHEHETYEGKGTIARDQTKNEGIEDLHSTEEGRNESRILLERYDLGEVYYVRGSGEQEHCEVRKVNGSLPEYWDWLKDAKYTGQRTVHEMTMDVWEYRGAGVRVELLVAQDAPNVPRYLNGEVGTSRRELIFLTFNAMTPPATDFTIPKACQE